MSDSPTISVVIPAHNAEKTIEETIESVLDQTFTDFELIIINDGSTDKTLEIIEHYTDLRIKVFSFNNSGPQKSRNRGIEKACGRFISFLDADDVWTQDKLELQLEALINNSDARVVYSWTDVIDERNNFLRRGGRSTKKGNVFLDLVFTNLLENGSNFLAYTDAVKSCGGFDERIIAGQDHEIALSLSSRFLFELVPKVQVLYRKSRKEESWSSGIKRARKGIDQVFEKHLLNREDLSAYQTIFIGNSYKYLVFECLNNFPSREKGFYCLQLFWVLLRNDPDLLTQKIFVKICLRILLTMLLPTKASRRLFEVPPFWLDITSLYGYSKTEPLPPEEIKAIALSK
ncbi:MAG: glycosyltransferase family 2 protein [Leptolyngbyaceae cyanobacterium]